jgi:hypothetical protein
MYNNGLFISFCEARNLKKSTINGYTAALKLYISLVNMQLEDLIKEAHSEEEKGILLKNRKIKDYLIRYRSYLLKSLSSRSAREYFSKVKTFYKHFEVEIPYLPAVKYGVDYEIYYNDLPTKNHIKKALSISSYEMKAIIQFMATSGTAKAETLSLTVYDFVEATKDYHDNNGLKNILNLLEKRNDVVPTWYLKRLKTDKYYYTFNHPEATKAIIKYLKSRGKINLEDKLFTLSPSLLLARFQQINDHFKWGFKGTYRLFRSHALRKFHASNIGLSTEDIDSLQGRTKKIVHETYIKPNPEKLKIIYMEAMDNLSLTDEYFQNNTIKSFKRENKEQKVVIIYINSLNIPNHQLNRDFNIFSRDNN